jgi:hypothetical protein
MSQPIIYRRFNQLGQFDVFDADIKLAKDTLNRVYMNVYTNAEGTAYANDSMGQSIENRLVNYTRYTLPYTDAANNAVVGKMRIYFVGNTYFEVGNDNETGYWYSIQGLTPYTVNQFT